MNWLNRKDEQKQRSKREQSGAIMLEVVAVLSLMGLMGAMLFRQMYMRNQELHNIQMASEIRIIKDAFAAYIQANLPILKRNCPAGGANEVPECDNTRNPLGRVDLLDGVKDYLPDGYFVANDLGYNYTLHLFSYFRGGADSLRSFYGVVVPQPQMLPNGGVPSSEWNFRRAARVAMLIGVDGGAYGKGLTLDDPDNPQNCGEIGGESRVISGAVGTWSLCVSPDLGEDISECDDAGSAEEKDCPLYVAITGTDVFQPDVELPDAEVNLPDNWTLALNGLHVYDSGFSVGGGTPSCYTISHGTFDASTGAVNSDGVPNMAGSPTCRPAFWVEGSADGTKGTGNVHVLNDLNVGYDPDNLGNGPAMRLDKNGMIVWERTADKVYDPQTNAEINYKLDPKYTSVMNDIKIMSRGGAKLSDLLPNYILKTQEDKRCSLGSSPSYSNYCTVTVNKPTDCPIGYKVGVVVIPTMFGLHTTALYPATGSTPANTVNAGTPVTLWRGKFYVNVVNSGGSDVPVPLVENRPTITSPVPTWTIKFGYDRASDHSGNTEEIHAIVQTYCVFDVGTFDWNGSGTGTGTAPTADRTQLTPTQCATYTRETACKSVGCKWTTGNTPPCAP